jgi:hypothetical protein
MSRYFLVEDKKFVIRSMAFISNSIKVPDDGGKYWQVKHDYQTPKDSDSWGGLPRSIVIGHKRNYPDHARSLPEVFMLKGPSSGDFTPLTEPLQVLWLELLDSFSGYFRSMDELLYVWENVTAQARALTDGHSREHGFADYIIGSNLGAKPMAIGYYVCGGNLLKQKYRIGSRIWVEAIHTGKSLPNINELLLKPWLVQLATESTVMKRNNGTYTVTPWHWN